MALEAELEKLLNRESCENESDTPDFILAEYLIGCLAVFNRATIKRSRWYGHAGITNAAQIGVEEAMGGERDGED